MYSRFGIFAIATAMAAVPIPTSALPTGSAAPSSRATSSASALAELEAWLALPAEDRKLDAKALQRPLSSPVAATALQRLAAARLDALATEYRAAVAKEAISADGKTLRWESRVFGEAPPSGRSLWISLHGGGNAPRAVNDQQWRNQIRLYQPAEGIYLAPRAPTDTWNLWHEAHIDSLLQKLIDAQVAVNGVNPDRVYLLGYSAGGDGVWQLAPRMADRFAAAATMAGHPNEASPVSLRNLPFALFMGGADAAYDRNRTAVERTAELRRLRASDPDGYVAMSRIYDGLPHWMNGKDAEALPWMAKFTRNPWPRRIVWLQDDVTNDRFYWLQIPDRTVAKAGDRIDAVVTGQNITLNGDVPSGMALRLSDQLIDLDKAVTVTVNGKLAFRGKVPRTAGAIHASLMERADMRSAATALLMLGQRTSR